MDSICLLLGWLFGVRDVDCQAAPLGLLVLDERHPDRESFVAIVVPGRVHRRRTDKEDGDLVAILNAPAKLADEDRYLKQIEENL